MQAYIEQHPFNLSSSDPDLLLEHWYAWLKNAVEKFVPRRTKHRQALAVWVKPSTSNIIKRLQTAKLRGETRKVEDLRSQVSMALTNDECEYKEKVFKSRNTHLLFKHFKSLRHTSSLPPVLKDENHQYISASDKAKALNNYFHSVFSTPDKSSSIHLQQNHCMPPNCYDYPVSETFIHETMSSLDVTKTRGPDELPPVLFKKLSLHLAKSLNVLFQTFISLTKSS